MGAGSKASAVAGQIATRTLVLAGNPNVGKSVFFNHLTGTYVDVSNFPGTTVEIMRGRHGEWEVLDTPGVYGIGSFNDEETVARDVILAADVVVNVVDAVHPERDLFLTLHLIDLGLPMIVALNMADEARKQGVAIDRDLLEDLLGVSVVETVAVSGVGFDELAERLPQARRGHADYALEVDILQIASRVGTRAEALLVLEGDEMMAERHGLEPGTQRDEIYSRRRDRVNDIIGHVVTASDEGLDMSARISRMMLNPVTGVPLLALLLAVVYVVLGR
ncbi:MAG: 50S ribosome-binding GTPase, partial [Coriobacteriia bacterium]|nr:50S ribosome-binding GTPase [Coriobacteriia bacterium]